MIGVILLSILTFSCAVKFDSNAVIPSVAERAQPGVPGGKEVVALTDQEYPQLLKLSTEAIKQLDTLSTNSNKVHFLIRIKEAARAVVAGWMHEITFYLGECTDGTYTAREPVLQSSHTADVTTWVAEPPCTINQNGEFGICWVRILEQNWLNVTKVQDGYKCKIVPKQEAYASA